MGLDGAAYPLGDAAQRAGGVHDAELQLPEQEIKLEDPKGTVFYRAPRGGKNGTPFLCLNLRCMDLVRSLHDKLEHIRAYFCVIQTTNLCNADFRHQNGVFPEVEAG